MSVEYSALIGLVMLVAVAGVMKLSVKILEKNCQAIEGLSGVEHNTFQFGQMPDGMYVCIGEDESTAEGGYMDHFRGIHISFG